MRATLSRVLYYGVAAVAVLMACTAAVATFAPGTVGEINRAVRNQPSAAVPDTVDLGEVEADEQVTATFILENTGYGPLSVSGVRTGCACVGLERKSGEGYAAVSEFTVAAGERLELALRFRVSDAPGQAFRAGVQFLTNDPRRPEVAVRVVARVKGGLVFHPPAVVMNNVLVGDGSSVQVAVCGPADSVRTVRRVRAVNLDGLSCRFAPHAGEPARHPVTNDPVVGHIELTYVAQKPGPISGHVEVETDAPGDKPLRVPVTGSATGLLRLSPASVRLPLHSDDGPLYATRCLYRSAVSGAEPVVKAVSVPAALEVTVGAGQVGGGSLQVAVKGPFRKPDRPVTYTVVLEVAVEHRVARVDLPVTISP